MEDRDPGPETEALYRTLSIERLRQLRRAFEADRLSSLDRANEQFCVGRIALIDRLLRDGGRELLQADASARRN